MSLAKALLVLAILATGYVYASSKFESKYLKDNKAISHYSGCLTGFLIILKLDMYKRPDHIKTPQEAVKMVRDQCTKETEEFRKSL